jgi:3-oxoacyl-[acyl-carrier-protein] synthase-3
MMKSKIVAVGHYVPERIVTNDELAQYMDTNDDWITERTGIKERRFYKNGFDTVSNMAGKAAKVAAERANIDLKTIDFIIFATLSPDYHFPGSAVLLQRDLGLPGIPALDIRQQCAGFLYGLSIADQYIKSGMYKNILLVGSEIHSNIMELSNRGRNVSVIFGDGAGACIIQATDSSDSSGILSTHIHADGTHAEELAMQHPGSRLDVWITPEMIENGTLLPYMNGQMVFKEALKRFPEVIKEALDFNKLTVSDIDLLIPHQANLRISQMVQQLLGLSDNQVFNNIQKYGNTTAASIPLALSEAWEQNRFQKGDLICLAAFGSGFVWGSSLIVW